MHNLAGKQGNRDKIGEFLRAGLHFCRHYENLVQYRPEFCGKCPHNGLRRPTAGAPPSETCF
ncbi:MAG: hypothetical protein NWE75_05280 [Candidatus Bathyarchaeota archaeon]|nr:hypothetical protein [Candidatus Bathyarchaeota archaeon]